MNKLTSLAAIAVSAALVAPVAAQAGVSVSSTPFDSAPGAGQVVVADFDSAPADGFTFSGGGIYQGLTPSVAAPPAGDSTKFAAVTTGNTATLSSLLNLSSLSLYIGSIDAYNTITFSGDGGFTKSYTGAELYQPANGNQSSGETNRRFDFAFDGVDVNTVKFDSSANSFEFDNIAVSTVSAAPEPGVWALLIAGVAMMGAALRFGRKRQVGPSFAAV